MEELEDDDYLFGSVKTESEFLTKKLRAYEEFNFSQQADTSSLAIDSKKQIILDLLKKQSAIIIKGFTGCGKSTRVPQFILDDCYRKKVPCNIVVTQPRRIAAMSISQRVSTERGWPLGTVVGYQVFHFICFLRIFRLKYYFIPTGVHGQTDKQRLYLPDLHDHRLPSGYACGSQVSPRLHSFNN